VPRQLGHDSEPVGEMIVSEYLCRICGSVSRKAKYSVREMMFGTRDEFEYDECLACCSLQLGNVPDREALSRYYPKDYYSFALSCSDKNSLQRFAFWLETERDKAFFGLRSPLGQVLQLVKPKHGSPLLPILKSAGLRPGKRALDVGCGDGSLLNQLAKCGFKDLVGIDPFIESDAITSYGIPIWRRQLVEIQESFDLIMFHHSFEHVLSPRDELRSAHLKLRAGGRCLIRIPTPSSEAWETYGIDWVQLDAPRHLTLISRSGMTALAEQCGFSVVSVIDDATGWSYMGSELCRRGISYRKQDMNSHFSRDSILDYEMRAAAANNAHRGDQAAFVLAKL
jgi:SAM-dependent methyltransferase